MQDDSFHQRRDWFAEYCINQENKAVIHEEQPGVLYPCPCCGYPTLTSRGAWDICKLCNWEDDGQDDPYADEVWGGPNGRYSLTQARENFQQYLIMYSPNDTKPRIGGVQNSVVEHQAKREMVKTFDAMVGETDPRQMDRLWQVIQEQTAMLHAELDRRIKDFEAKSRE